MKRGNQLINLFFGFPISRGRPITTATPPQPPLLPFTSVSLHNCDKQINILSLLIFTCPILFSAPSKGDGLLPQGLNWTILISSLEYCLSSDSGKHYHRMMPTSWCQCWVMLVLFFFCFTVFSSLSTHRIKWHCEKPCKIIQEVYYSSALLNLPTPATHEAGALTH